MKFYDKHLTPLSRDIQQMIMVLVIFIIGFVVGYFVGSYEKPSEFKEKESNQISTNVAISNEFWYNS